MRPLFLTSEGNHAREYDYENDKISKLMKDKNKKVDIEVPKTYSTLPPPPPPKEDGQTDKSEKSGTQSCNSEWSCKLGKIAHQLTPTLLQTFMLHAFMLQNYFTLFSRSFR